MRNREQRDRRPKICWIIFTLSWSKYIRNLSIMMKQGNNELLTLGIDLSYQLLQRNHFINKGNRKQTTLYSIIYWNPNWVQTLDSPILIRKVNNYNIIFILLHITWHSISACLRMCLDSTLFELFLNLPIPKSLSVIPDANIYLLLKED